MRRCDVIVSREMEGEGVNDCQLRGKGAGGAMVLGYDGQLREEGEGWVVQPVRRESTRRGLTVI